MKDQFIPSPSLGDAHAIAEWLTNLPNNSLIEMPRGGYPRPDQVTLIDWHIIPVEGNYQVIAHITVSA